MLWDQGTQNSPQVLEPRRCFIYHVLLKSGGSQEWALQGRLCSGHSVADITSHPLCMSACLCLEPNGFREKKKGKKKFEVCFLSTFPLFYTAACPASIVFSQLEKI